MLDLSPEDEKITTAFINDIRVLQNYDLPPKMDKLPIIPSILRGIKMSRYLKFLFILNKQRKFLIFLMLFLIKKVQVIQLVVRWLGLKKLQINILR